MRERSMTLLFFAASAAALLAGLVLDPVLPAETVTRLDHAGYVMALLTAASVLGDAIRERR